MEASGAEGRLVTVVRVNNKRSSGMALIWDIGLVCFVVMDASRFSRFNEYTCV